MKNYRSPGNTLTLIAPGGGVESGNPYIIGGTFCIAMGDADAGDSFVGLVSGVAGLTKGSATTAAAGAAAYFNEGTGLIETSDSSSNRRIGVWAEVGANGSTNARIRLDGKSFGAGDDDLEAKADSADLASTSNGLGASLIGVEDADADWTATDVEGVLAEIADRYPTAADLSSTANGEGASTIGIEDTAGEYDSDNVEDALAELVDWIPDIATKQVVISLGNPSGTAGADADWIGATVIGCVPVSGNDQTLVSVAIDGSGVVTVTVGGNESAEATFNVTALLV